MVQSFTIWYAFLKIAEIKAAIAKLEQTSTVTNTLFEFTNVCGIAIGDGFLAVECLFKCLYLLLMI